MFWWFEHKLVWVHHTALGLATIGQDRPALCDNEPCAYGDSLALPTGCDVRGFVGEKRSIPALS